ncbi:MAG: diguanylate cyclase [Hahellaceae bacterium]|nr:diguanylate cyclase [Hahellaceae bacterium]
MLEDVFKRPVRPRRSSIPGWLFPAYRLMASQGYQTKFYLISIFTAVPLLVLSLVLMDDLFNSFRQNDAIRERLRRIEVLNELRWGLEDVRDLSVRREVSSDDVIERLYSQSRGQALEHLEALRPSGKGPLKRAEEEYIERIRNELSESPVPPGAGGLRLSQVFENANGATLVLREWVVTLGRMGRALTPENQALQLELDQISELVFRLSRCLGSLRAYGAALLGRNYLAEDAAEMIDIALNELERELQILDLKVGARGDPEVTRIVARTRETYHFIEQSFTAGGLETPWRVYFSHLTETLQAYRNFESHLQQTLSDDLKSSARSGFNKLIGMGFLLFATIVVYIYLMLGLYVSVMKSVKNLAESAKRVARGDLESPIKGETADEMQIIAESMDAMRQQLQIRERELREISLIDGLTGLRNRRYFDESLLAHFALGKRRKGHFALVLIDLDFFKQINDRYGHAAGDHVLQDVASHFKDFFRRERDVVARFGGEEFSILLPETEGAQALSLIERLRSVIESAQICFESHVLPVTISAGVAVFDGYLPLTAQALMRAADEALYRAKRSGRNRVELAQQEDPGEDWVMPDGTPEASPDAEAP